MSVARRFNHFTALVYSGASKVAGNIESIGQPIDPRPEFVFQLVNQILCQKGVRALVIGVDSNRLRRAHGFCVQANLALSILTETWARSQCLASQNYSRRSANISEANQMR